MSYISELDVQNFNQATTCQIGMPLAGFYNEKGNCLLNNIK
jgi:hypothetical protein